MDLFKSYVLDFEEAIKDAQAQIPSIAGLSGDELRSKQNEIETAINEANQHITAMTVAIPNLTNQQQAKDTIDKCKTRLTAVNKEYRKANESAQGKSDRLALLGGTDNDSLKSVQARTAILSDTDTLKQGEDNLKSINQRVNAIGAQGVATLDEIGNQGERMNSQRSRLEGIRAKVRDSERLIRAISARMSVNDFMKIGIMIVLVIFICLVIYLRWIRKLVKTSPAPGAPVNQLPPAGSPLTTNPDYALPPEMP